MHPWELHPALIHFPLALLLAGFAIEMVARLWRRDGIARVGVGLLVAGVVTGLIAAGAGAVAYLTVPAHTEAAHGQMTLHFLAASAAVILFALVALARWRRRDQPASVLALSGGFLGSALLVAAAFLGGKAVYHGGAGVAPEILAPEIAQGHHHHHDDDLADEHAAAAPAHADHVSTESAAALAQGHAHGEERHEHLHAHAEQPTGPPPGTHTDAPLFDPDEDLAGRQIPR